MTAIIALDIATKSGWARGSHDTLRPEFGSVEFAAAAGSSDAAVFARAMRWFREFFVYEGEAPVLILEAMLPMGAIKGETQRHVRDRLSGLHAIAKASAFEAGIYNIRTVQVADVRQHFINDRSLKRHQAKREVIRQCVRMGWLVANDDEGDACALWSYGCALVDPRSALRCSPLFGKGVAL